MSFLDGSAGRAATCCDSWYWPNHEKLGARLAACSANQIRACWVALLLRETVSDAILGVLGFLPSLPT